MSMGKLIELLNECTNGRFKSEDDLRLCIEMRGYCRNFIKWLVENDKIDFENQAMQYAKSDLSKFFIEWEDENGMSDNYAMLLMLLAIQDEPIRFLCEILK